MLTFTGERVIPGVVEPDLWSEHVSRYYFARQFARNQRSLDIGCGAGYGANLVGAVAEQSLGIDVSHEAVQYAASRAENGACFCVGSADAIPAPNGSFGLITAFEVIEHVPNWKGLISEAARTLTSEGVFLVSTPNKVYYAETRQSAGPNPFHVHEFELGEFQNELQNCFSHVTVLAQNHQETLAFAGENSSGASNGYLSASPALADAHFFLAVCSQRPISISAFLYAASCGNLLKERETYIHLLKEEVHLQARELSSLRTQWIDSRDELAKVNAEADRLRDEIKKVNVEADRLRDQLEEVNADADQLRDERRLAAQSKWLRLGRQLGLGPKL